MPKSGIVTYHIHERDAVSDADEAPQVRLPMIGPSFAWRK